MTDHEQRIRTRAYRIWEEEGRPEGRAEVHWDMARELVAVEDNFEDTLKPAPSLGADDRSGEPIEEALADTGGELPTMTDQDEQTYPPSREAAKKGTPRRSS
jgi:hypothetical protein